MASGGTMGNTGQTQNATAQALQNYPIVPNSAGGAQSSAAGANPQAQSLSQLQTALQRLGGNGTPGGPARSPAGQTAALGQMAMQAGQQQQMPRQIMPQNRPMGAPQGMQSPQAPQLVGGMPQQGGMTVQQLNQMLAQRNGLMG
jgi:hypothetical protein